MKTFKLYFQNIDFENTSFHDKIDIGEFNSIEDLKKNYLNYFKEDYPIMDWEIMHFDERIKKVNGSDGIILAVNKLVFGISQLKKINNSEKNPLLNMLKNVPILPSLLCVEYS